MEPLTRLAEVVGPSHLITEPEQTLRYVIDERGLYKGRPFAVIRPGTTSEVSQVVSLCDEYDIAMVPQGGNTSYCGGATPDAAGIERDFWDIVEEGSAMHNVQVKPPRYRCHLGCILAIWVAFFSRWQRYRC